MREDLKSYRQAFQEVWKEGERPTQEVGQLLNTVSIQLGCIIAELNLRGVPWEVIDKHVTQSLLRGVDKTMGKPEE